MTTHLSYAEKAKAGKQVAQTLEYTVTHKAGDSQQVEKRALSYLLFLPSDYKPESGKKWPLLLHLHGAGERGNDLNKIKVHGPPNLVDHPDKAKEWPFITVSPQCPEDAWDWGGMQVLGLLLDEIEKRYDVDKDRIYVTGLSMGGFGTWALVSQYPERFAAGMPICGGFDPAKAGRLVKVPLWVFHGDKDDIVPLVKSTEMVDAIKAAGGTRVKLTVYPDVDHNSWSMTYDNPEVYRWLLEQNRTKNK